MVIINNNNGLIT